MPDAKSRHVWLWIKGKWDSGEWDVKVSLQKPVEDPYGTYMYDFSILGSQCIHEYGDIPKPNTARLVDTSRNQYRCPRCEKWRDNDICQCADREHGLRAEKTRAFVVEEIPLADAQSPGKLQSH